MFRMLMTSYRNGCVCPDHRYAIINQRRRSMSHLPGFQALSQPSVLPVRMLPFLHAGDSLSPSVLVDNDHMVDLLNLISPDFMTVGNHEFDFGPDVLETAIAKLNFPMRSLKPMAVPLHKQHG